MPIFADETHMHYAASRTRFEPGMAFRLDEAYRLAHLPLVAPDHPDSIAEGNGYRMGVHAPSSSLVLPIDAEALARSENYIALEAALRASQFAGKIAWDLLPRRASRLHATLCGGLEVIEGRLPPDRRALLAALGPVDFEVRGLFSGNRNLGRLYLAVYPELRGSEQGFAAVQRAVGRQPNAMALIGQFNLTDHLDVEETAALATILNTFRKTLFLTGQADELRVLRSADDLVLDAAYTDHIALG